MAVGSLELYAPEVKASLLQCALCIILGCISHLAIILLFGVLTVKYHEMTKNYIFREFECGLTREQTAELCFKSVRTVTEWDKGKPIPPECKRLMRMVKGRLISTDPCWENFKMHYSRMELPTGKMITAQELLVGIALIEIQSELELRTSTKILRYSRAISKLKNY